MLALLGVGNLLGEGVVGPGINYMKGKRAGSNMTCNSVKIVLLKG
jgi:hypothetical protein